jgi:REP element-mobilizing transposase RayT
VSDLQFFNPYAYIRFAGNRLPHWQQKGAVYFVTFRLADAIPQKLRDQWEQKREVWMRFHPPPWTGEVEREYHQEFSSAIEHWLDAGYGSCVLRRRDCAEVMADALRYFDGQRLALISSVVMPNHVHALFVQSGEWPLEKLLRSWKSFTSRKICALLHRDGSLWQRDYFDRLVRDKKHFRNCARYIRKNPARMYLRDGEYILYESELAGGIE